MSLLGPDREQVAAAEQEFVARVRARQIDPTEHMLAEGIRGDVPRPGAQHIPELMDLSLLSLVGEVLLKALAELSEDKS